MSCRWAIDAFGVANDFNALKNPVQFDKAVLDNTQHIADRFTHDMSHLMSSWIALVIIAVVALLICVCILCGRRRTMFHPNFMGARSLEHFTSFVASNAVVILTALGIACLIAYVIHALL